MTQKVIKVGSSAAVVIPKKSLKELGLSVGDEVVVDVRPSQQTVFIKSAAPSTRRGNRITKLTLDFVERYREDLERLADK